VLAPFPTVTTAFGAVMRDLNDRNGTSFAPFEHTPENVARCFEAMDAYWASRVGETPQRERVVGRPSADRERLLETIRPLLERGRARSELERARARYEELVGTA
jgi:hypothetical protein